MLCCAVRAVSHAVPCCTGCAMQHQVGTFQEDKEFDALLIDVNAPGGAFDVFDGELLWHIHCAI